MCDLYFQTLCRWVLSVKKNYRPVSYHNWRHALNVCQTMFTVLRTGKMDRFMDDIEVGATHTINTYLLDVLWCQPIKLIHVVSTSEFHEY